VVVALSRWCLRLEKSKVMQVEMTSTSNASEEEEDEEEEEEYIL
jgi:hypothetical protein